MVELDYNYMFGMQLVDYAMLWLEIGRLEQAAQLLGASAALQDSMSVYLPFPGQRTYDRIMDQVRALLGTDTFLAAWEAGRKLSYDEAIALVLENED